MDKKSKIYNLIYSHPVHTCRDRQNAAAAYSKASFRDLLGDFFQMSEHFRSEVSLELDQF